MFATHRLVLDQHVWSPPWERCGSVDRCPRLALGLARTLADARDALLNSSPLKRGRTSPLRLSALPGTKGSALAKIQDNPDDTKDKVHRNPHASMLRGRQVRCRPTALPGLSSALYYYVLLGSLLRTWKAIIGVNAEFCRLYITLDVLSRLSSS